MCKSTEARCTCLILATAPTNKSDCFLKELPDSSDEAEKESNTCAWLSVPLTLNGFMPKGAHNSHEKNSLSPILDEKSMVDVLIAETLDSVLLESEV